MTDQEQKQNIEGTPRKVKKGGLSLGIILGLIGLFAVGAVAVLWLPSLLGSRDEEVVSLAERVESVVPSASEATAVEPVSNAAIETTETANTSVATTTTVAATTASAAATTTTTTSTARPATSTTALPAARTAESATVRLFPGTTGNYDVNLLQAPPLRSENEFVAWMRANTTQEETYLRQRFQRAQIALSWRDILDDRVLAAFLLTPREFFCRTQNLPRAYAHAWLSIGYGQTISGPHIVAHMTTYLNVQPESRVLEIGTGSGYQSALLAHLSNHVYTIEIVDALAVETDAIYTQRAAEYPEYSNITRKRDDGYYGWEQYAPFDRIIVTCGIDHIPPALLQQLAPNGIMVIPVGPPSSQTILKITKLVAADGTVTLAREDIYQGRIRDVFVPFTAFDGTRHTEQE